MLATPGSAGSGQPHAFKVAANGWPPALPRSETGASYHWSHALSVFPITMAAPAFLGLGCCARPRKCGTVCRVATAWPVLSELLDVIPLAHESECLPAIP